MAFDPHRADEIHAHRPLRPTRHKWELDHNSDDVRGWSVVDRTGKRIGVVTHMYVDPTSGNVAEVEIEGGRTFSAHDLLLGDHFLTLTTTPEPNTQPVVIATPPPAEPEPATPPVAITPAPPVAPALRSVPMTSEAAPKSSAQAARDDRDDLIVQLIDKAR